MSVPQLSEEVQLPIRKAEKYAHLPGSYVFKPMAIESLGSRSESALNLFLYLFLRISSATGDNREGMFLFQRLSITLQRFSAPELCREWGAGGLVILTSFNFLTLGCPHPRALKTKTTNT